MRKKIKIIAISLIVVIASSLSIIFGIMIFSNKPSARFGIGLVYDKSVKKLILFGGGYQDSTSHTYYGDTWCYDPIVNLWTELFPSNSPSARSSHSMVYDPVNQKIILFGGVDLSDNWLNETWIYDSTTNSWTQVFPDSAPPIRGSASMFYDVQTQKVIVFGGYRDSGNHLDDTWAYDYTTNNWTNLNPISKPTGRYGAPMIYDPINQRGLMFGGRTSTYLDESWVYYYSNNTWLELILATKPTERYWEGLTFDESAQKVILFGG
ncbi:MAG TPA: kelch repeat-containing protein [Candidatus Nanopelagicaceae bacterium]|nr:kelch repeat-containing protein [Candidatus Nanopelagicaceae bacterium]